jgi:hypothetical protein
MLKVFEIHDSDMVVVQRVLRQSGYPDLAKRIDNRTCNTDEHLVFDVKAFRAFWDTSDEEVAEVLERATDDDIRALIDDTFIMKGWEETCEHVFSNLKYDQKNKESK